MTDDDLKVLLDEYKETTLGDSLGTSTLPSSSALRSEAYSTLQYVPHRGLTEDTLRFFGMKTRVAEDGKPIATELPYGSATLVRDWATKRFRWTGFSTNASLFGIEKFSAGQARYVTICESGYDAASVYQMLGSKYPVVSVRSATTARGDCEKARDFLNSFERVYLCLDNDVAGQTAASEIAKLFDSSKVYYVNLTTHKDANEYLTASEADAKAFVSIWYNARPYLPRGIVNSYEDVEGILAKAENGAVASWPFKTLESATCGIRLREVNLVTAQEGVGKTEVLRAIEYHLLKTTDDNIAVIHLEEGEKRATQGLIGYELGLPVHLPDSGVTLEDQLGAYKTLTKRDGRLHFYAHFGSDDPDVILDIIRYLATVCHCKFIFLDHITMLVTGYEGEDERKKLDYLSTRLAMLTRELGFTLFLVSHVNDDGKTRGSRNISKVADLVVYLHRDVEASTLETRTQTEIMIKKNRYTGRTGPAGYLKFDSKSFTLKEVELEEGSISDIDLSIAA